MVGWLKVLTDHVGEKTRSQTWGLERGFQLHLQGPSALMVPEGISAYVVHACFLMYSYVHTHIHTFIYMLTFFF